MLGDHKHISIESYVRDRHIVCFLCVVVPESHFDLLSVSSNSTHRGKGNCDVYIFMPAGCLFLLSLSLSLCLSLPSTAVIFLFHPHSSKTESFSELCYTTALPLSSRFSFPFFYLSVSHSLHTLFPPPFSACPRSGPSPTDVLCFSSVAGCHVRSTRPGPRT